MKNETHLVKIALSFCLLATISPARQANAQNTASSPLGAYASTHTYCGDDAIPRNPTAIPWIGCFYLSPGHSASGTFSGQPVEVGVRADGQEVLSNHGAVVESVSGPQRPGSGISHLNILARNPDKSVLFMVSECFPPTSHVCVLTQKNWDAEQALRHQ